MFWNWQESDGMLSCKMLGRLQGYQRHCGFQYCVMHDTWCSNDSGGPNLLLPKEFQCVLRSVELSKLVQLQWPLHQGEVHMQSSVLWIGLQKHLLGRLVLRPGKEHLRSKLRPNQIHKSRESVYIDVLKRIRGRCNQQVYNMRFDMPTPV